MTELQTGRASRPAMSDEIRYWLAFNRIPSIGRARFERLERAFGSLSAAWIASPAALRAAGLDERAIDTIARHRQAIAPESELAALERLGAWAVNWNDDAYPALLKQIYDRPPVLYVRGTIQREDELALAVVGTRKMTSYGRMVTEVITSDLARAGTTIVSGLARGVDATAHTAAIMVRGRTIAVLPCGVDQVYPASHAALARQIVEHGALVSEHPPGTRPQKDSFPRRNRIIAGLSLGIVVTEAPVGSGALLTAKLGADENRDVFAVPGGIFSATSAGTNALIQDGAKLTRSAEDVLTELNLTVAAAQAELEQVLPAGETEAALLICLGTEPMHIDEVTRKASLGASEVSSGLALLELKGLVRQVGGMHYVRLREGGAPYNR